MFSINPFAELSVHIPAAVMQAYLFLMILAVVGGTLFDVIHKGSAKYFFSNFRKSKEQGSPLGVGTKAGVVAKTIASDVLTSSELCGWKRRTAHLLGMYGFVLNVGATLMMVMFYTTPEGSTPAIWPQLWTIGAIMVCTGTSWFWFFIRVDVSAEGSSPFRIVRADLFILSVFATNAFALLWAYVQSIDSAWAFVFLICYLIATTVLFGGVPWSKFSHMFFKPAAAMEKGFSVANGSRNNLPEPADRSDPETRDRHSMLLLKDAPLNMGLGIKRESPNHY
ncbi:MAG: adenylyl-sulfate reductase [Rhodospirillaceae bacterium TMED8]|nr:adenylyl-sulfate reductase [Magnetovibrio sp.]OUT51459.1 MAG: adenylyl-sulfate reductase [Rhodospirillaceae bacterium TMED8]|tara:strand:- start:1962 stop:2801 length:840 start_codon:yes stop_codon:yes gene_type:complete